MTVNPLKYPQLEISASYLRRSWTAIPVAPFSSRLTPESFAALAVEHLCLLDLARCAVLAGIWLAGVVATFTYAAAIKTVATVLLQVEHTVVDIEHADTAHQACGHGCLLSCAEKREGKKKIEKREGKKRLQPICHLLFQTWMAYLMPGKNQDLQTLVTFTQTFASLEQRQEKYDLPRAHCFRYFQSSGYVR